MQYLVPDELMTAFLVAVANQSDEPLLFRKGSPTLVEGLGEVYQDYDLVVVPNGVEMGDLLHDEDNCIDCE